MICIKCDHDLAECTCEDLEERFTKIIACEFLHIGEDYQHRIRAQIERNKTEQMRKE